MIRASHWIRLASLLVSLPWLLVSAENSPSKLPVLILTGAGHPAHDWRKVTAALVDTLGKDPRIDVAVSENIEDLASDRIRRYRVLLLNYTNWERPGLSEKAKSGLLRHLESGGGFVIIHGACLAFHPMIPNAPDSAWPEFRKISCRYWDARSGHDSYGPLRLHWVDSSHPIARGHGEFETMDELYYGLEGTEPIEVLATAHSSVTGRDEPMIWTSRYGKGRVFQTVLGHSEESIRKAGFIFRRGVRWAGETGE